MKPRVICFRLEKPFALLNQTADQHWSKRRQRNKQTSWDVKVALGAQRLAAPFARARVTIERCSVGTPDQDGLYGGAKSLIDSLLPMSRTHPAGLGLVADDAPSVMELEVKGIRVAARAESCTIVTIEELPAMSASSSKPFGMENHLGGIAGQLDAAKRQLELMDAVCKHQIDRHLHPLTCGVDSSHPPLFPVLSGGTVVLRCAWCSYEQTTIPAVFIRRG